MKFFHWRQRKDEELNTEIQNHLDMSVRERIERGESAEQARLNVRREFGNVGLVKEVTRAMWGWASFERLMQDLRFGLRMLRKRPGFTFIAILTLALGIGANTAIFSIVNAVLVNPLPYYDPARLVWVTEATARMNDDCVFSPDFVEWQTQARAFEHLAAFQPVSLNLTGRGEAERLECVWATANLFPTLGVTPRLGRTFTAEEDRPDAQRVALVSHAFWQRRFGSAPQVIGQSLTLGGKNYQVIGVLPDDFRLKREAEIWLPRALDYPRELRRETISPLNVIGRLKPEFTPEQARAELNLLARRIEQSTPNQIPGIQVSVIPFSERVVRDLRRVLLLLFGAAALVLLIACANVANLLLARASARQKELAIRVTLGAGRSRLVRQMLTESLLLSGCGGVAGLLLAWWGVKALVAFAPADLGQLKDGKINGAVFGFTLLAALLAGLAAGLAPALQASRANLNECLKAGLGKLALLTPHGARRVSPLLIIGELALTLVLLAGAGLLVKSLWQIRAFEPGYNPQHLLTMMIQLSRAKYPPGEPQQKAFYQALLARLQALPGVRAAAISESLPLTGKAATMPLAIEGRPLLPDAQRPKVDQSMISHDYFRTMEIPLRAGRSFTPHDNENAPQVAIINEAAAQRYFSGENPLGQRILFLVGQPEQYAATIVGVVGNEVMSYGLEPEIRPRVYQPYLLNAAYLSFMKLAVRTVGDPLDWVAAVRSQVAAIDADQPVYSVLTMEQRLAETLAPRRFQMLLFGLFAAVALVLAAVGVYGVISYSVSRRRHEIGIRMALGAQARDVQWLVVRQGLALALVGVTVGLAAAYGLTSSMASLLFNVKPTDPVTFAVISSLLVGITFLAAYFPARRATQVDPLVALRHE